MTLPRSRLIDVSATPYYHCMSRCVRRAFLCGKDDRTGLDFEHRRGWIEARLLLLADVFALDVCAYAIMSNHYHVVLRLNPAEEQGWDDHEVIERWQRLHKIPYGFDAWDKRRKDSQLRIWRERLSSISWFMKCLNEPLARFANREDGCTGRFWEGRFKSQALLDEEAVLKCMAYVDLNPIRAQMADTPEQSDHTSIQARINDRADSLAPFSDEESPAKPVLPITKANYYTLVDITGRQLREDKSGAIQAELPPIIKRLANANARPWLEEMQALTRHYFRAIGNTMSLSHYRTHLGQQRLKGLVK